MPLLCIGFKEYHKSFWIAIPQLPALPDPDMNHSAIPEGNESEENIPLEKLLQSLDEAAVKQGLSAENRTLLSKFIKSSSLSLQISGTPLQVKYLWFFVIIDVRVACIGPRFLQSVVEQVLQCPVLHDEWTPPCGV